MDAARRFALPEITQITPLPILTKNAIARAKTLPPSQTEQTGSRTTCFFVVIRNCIVDARYAADSTFLFSRH